MEVFHAMLFLNSRCVSMLSQTVRRYTAIDSKCDEGLARGMRRVIKCVAGRWS
jgi:hypothetical protein